MNLMSSSDQQSQQQQKSSSLLVVPSLPSSIISNTKNEETVPFSSTTIRSHYLSAHLRQVGGIPVKIEASSETLKDELPHNSWMPDFQYVVEGKQVGYAVRETGDDLIYVKFPIVRENNNNNNVNTNNSSSNNNNNTNNSTGGDNNNNRNGNVIFGNNNLVGVNNNSSSSNNNLYPPPSIQLIGLTIPRRFLVPVSLPQDGSVPSAANSPTYKPSPRTVTTTSAPTNYNSSNMIIHSGANGTATVVSSQEAFISKLLSESLGRKSTKEGKPLLCVVCGAWNTEGGQVRRSGFKCKNCIGQKSVARLKDAYQKLMQNDPVEE